MPKKRLLIFRSGNYTPQGEFSTERVKKIFGKAAESPGVFVHSSKFVGTGLEPPKVGEFSNITIEENEKGAEVYADFEFNGLGVALSRGNAFGGVSVEIPEDNLKKIALLPPGVKPAVDGAEFEEAPFYFEFEEPLQAEFNDQLTTIASIIAALNAIDIGKIEKEELRLLSSAVYKKLDVKHYIDKLKADGYTIKKNGGEFEDMSKLTPEEIKRIAREEFQAELATKDNVRKFFEDNKLKITPAMKEAGLNEEFMEHLVKSDYEFQEGSGVGEVLNKIFAAMPDAVKTTSALEGQEFQASTTDNPYQEGIDSAKATFGLQ